MASKQKLSRKQTKKLIPALKGFNKLAKVFVGLMQKRINTKEKRLNQVKLLIRNASGSSFAQMNEHHGIVIKNIGTAEMTIKKSGEMSYREKTDWRRLDPGKNKGVIL